MRNECVKLFAARFGKAPEAAASAPGRIEFIGNHTDYNGGLVMGAAIDRFLCAAAAKRRDGAIRIWSAAEKSETAGSLDEISPRQGAEAWANYPLGVLKMLRERGMKTAAGFDMAVAGDLPAGAGLSSSAALELAAALALGALYDFSLERKELALLCRKAENEFAGMPCGILDQGVSCFGRKNHLVLIDCREETFRPVPLPPRARFWIFNTHKKHTLVDSLYEKRFKECAEAFGRLRQTYPQARCLCDITPEQTNQIEWPSAVLRRRARHVTEENRRVRETVRLIEAGDLAAAGRLLYASHESSRNLFENSCPELDRLVDLLRKEKDVCGARLTGGGFGGAVMAMTGTGFTEHHAGKVLAAWRRDFSQPEADCLPARTADGASLLAC